MTEQRPDDGMIEIGDLEDEAPLGAAPAPHVVIEYRDRGIPWMLVPPLLALVAVVAGVGAYNYNESRKEKERRAVAAPVSKAPVDPVEDEELPDPVPGYPLTGSRFDGKAPPIAPEARIVANPPTPAPVPELPASPPTLVAAAPSPVVEPVVPDQPAAPQPDLAVGFDPDAFKNPLIPVAPATGSAPVDPNLAPVAQTVQPDETPVPAVNPDQPAQVDDDLLPPDPRKARADREQRAVRALRQAEADRYDFHARIGAISRKNLGRRAIPIIMELCKEFGQDVSPASKDQAIKLLGRTGQFAGASTARRINLLRQLGFPEPAILGDIVDIVGRHTSDGERNAPTRDDLYLQSVGILLRHPPGRAPGVARAGNTP